VAGPDYLLEPFARLDGDGEARLVAFLGRTDLVVRGVDRSPARPYRGGCLPYIGLVAGVAVGLLGEGWGLPRPVAIGVALALAILSLRAMVRTVIAVRRSKRLLAAEDGWHALAWTKEELCYRSLDRCLLAPFSAVRDVEVMGDDAGSFLAGTLWIHLQGKEKVLVEPRGDEGLFAGRRLSEWGKDLDRTWKRAKKS